MTDLPLVYPPQPRRVRGPRGESVTIYEIVCELRRRGCTVYRSGRGSHKVNGARLSDAQLRTYMEQSYGR